MKLAGVGVWVAGCALVGGASHAQTLTKAADRKVSVGTAPAKDARSQSFHDGKYGVRFEVPAGWSFSRNDGVVSTFHMDARSAPEQAQMRGVASLGFNPFPESVLSGATFYYSVARHTSERDCAEQARDGEGRSEVQDIGGMEFRHAHDEHGAICVEARDEVYTAYRKGSCYRFDLEVNTFCSVSSGASELTERQMVLVEQQMTDILSSVVLDWRKGGAHPVPVPEIHHAPLKKSEPELVPRRPAPLARGE